MNTRRGIKSLVMSAVALAAVLGLAAGVRARDELKAPPSERPPRPFVIAPEVEPKDVSRPSDADRYRDTPRVRHAPAFIAPLSGETAAGRAGIAGWTSPNTDVGSRGATQPDSAGWFGFGFAIEFGRPGTPADAGETIAPDRPKHQP